MKAKRLSRAQRSSKTQQSDIITKLPQTIIESILCLLPIEEAARTSILSREWRYKWTKIPKLVFSDRTLIRSTKENDRKQTSDLKIARRNMDTKCKLFYAIHQVLLLRQAPILDFTLSIYADESCFEIDQIILHLLRNHTVKKLKLNFAVGCFSYNLPLSFFSLHHLTDLYLESCAIDRKPVFSGFGSLTSLTLSRVYISRETLKHLLSNCLSLKSLCLFLHEDHISDDGRPPNIMELFKSFTLIEHLTTWGYIVGTFNLDSIPCGLATSLINLKYFCFQEMDFSNCDVLTFLVILLKCSPNLEKIKLQVGGVDYFDEETGKLEEYSDILEEYSDVWLEHLNELKIEYFTNTKPELELVKFVLARSPNLKKVILLTYISDKTEELELLDILLRAPRASPVQILVENPGRSCKKKKKS